MATYLKSMRHVSRFRHFWSGDLQYSSSQESGSMLVIAVPAGKRYLVKGDASGAALGDTGHRVNVAIGVNGTTKGQYVDRGGYAPLIFSSPFSAGTCNGFFKSKTPGTAGLLPPIQGNSVAAGIYGDQTSSSGSGTGFEFIAEANEQVHCRLGISRPGAGVGNYYYGADIFIYEIN